MPTPKESFEHGEHNQKACVLLKLNNFPDWAITTAFYASLHFVTSKIFPFEYSPDGKTKIKFNDITQWQAFKNYATNKRHTLINDLVSVHCSKISSEYDWLLNTSWNSRYHSHVHMPEIVNRAITYMETIKKFCDPSRNEIIKKVPNKK
jgi:hypothetical protein